MMKRIGRAVAFGLAVLTTGCSAGLKVRKVSSERDSTELGIRYYESAPYLLVHSNNDGGLTTKILYLPDSSRMMAATPYSRGASLKLTLQFAHGVLTQADSTADSTELPKAVIAAIEKAATAALAGNAPDGAGAEHPTVPTPYLYRIVISADTVELVGGQPGVLDPNGLLVPVPTIAVDPLGGAK